MQQKYLELINLARRLGDNREGLPVVRIAIIGDHAIQQLANVLRARLYQRGLFGEVYEAEFDTLRSEILDPASGLRAFAPEYTWVCLASQQYQRRLANTAADAQTALPRAWAQELIDLFESLAGCGGRIIVNNLAAPRERLFGNYSLQVSSSPYASVLEANRHLASAASAESGVYISDVAFLASRVGLDHWYDDRLWVHSKYPCAPRYFPLLAESCANLVQVMRGRIVKCVVLDLDNTLWGGVIGDDGLERIEIGGYGAGEAYEEFQRYLLQLKRRGLILAVCSKNDEANARLPFREHPGMVLREGDIAAFVANWEPKSENLRRISRLLNLGLDSFVFVDDSAFERNEVRRVFPEIQVPELPPDPSDYIACLEAGGFWETLGFTEDDRRRSDMYREEVARADLRERATNMDEYLGSLEMKMQCRPFDPLNLQRIAQLIQRSNQFNLRTQRYSQAQCRAFMDMPEKFPSFHFSLQDKFGDYGLISVVCGEVIGGELEIREWVMSCRVLNRGVEQSILGCLAQAARQRGLTSLVGEYAPSAKNRMVSDLYAQLGFKAQTAGDSGSRWRLELDAFTPPTTHISLT